MQFFFSPILGNISDAYGRRPVLLFSMFGAAIFYVMMCVAPSLFWLFAGRVVSGIAGASVTAANAYIADVSDSDTRRRNFGLSGACFGLGFVIGPLVGGLLGEVYGVRAPFVAAAILTGINGLYGFFVLPESHPIAHRRTIELRRMNPIGAFGVLRHYPMLLGMVVVIALDRLAHAALPSTWVLYTEHRFAWTPRENGLSLALVGLMYSAVQAGLTRRVVAAIGEPNAIIFGLFIGSITYALYGLVPAEWIYAVIIFGSIGGVAGPCLQSFITHQVDKSEQGAVQGAITGISGVAAVVGPLMATNLFGYFSSSAAPFYLPGAPFLLSSLLVGLAGMVAWRTGYKLLAGDSVLD
jgi:DHA1 family tetracycline resistance protein-like MFS transporter